jgi:hypothetical protein
MGRLVNEVVESLVNRSSGGGRADSHGGFSGANAAERSAGTGWRVRNGGRKQRGVIPV